MNIVLCPARRMPSGQIYRWRDNAVLMMMMMWVTASSEYAVNFAVILLSRSCGGREGEGGEGEVEVEGARDKGV